MAGQTAAVATGTSTSARKPQGRAVGLDVAEALAVVALLALSGARLRANIGFVTCNKRQSVSTMEIEMVGIRLGGNKDPTQYQGVGAYPAACLCSRNDVSNEFQSLTFDRLVLGKGGDVVMRGPDH